jgi:hypothetical protein
MKNVILSSILLLSLTAAHAQSGLVVRGGFNSSNAVIDPEIPDFIDQESRPGFNVAVLGDVSMGGPFYLLLGGGYETRGVRGEAGDGDGTVRLNYVTVPVMLSLRAPLAAGGPSIFLNVGSEPAWLVQSDLAFDDITFDADNFEDFDLGLRGELGMTIPFYPGGPAAMVGAGYTYSLTDANNDEDDEWHNYALHLFAGLRLPI